MTLNEFVKRFDIDNSIVLHEGKRNVINSNKEKLVLLGKILVSKTTRMTFRSGNADGSDYFFAEGVASIDNKRLQVITPYSWHRQKANQAYETFSLDDINIAADSEIAYQSKQKDRKAH